MYEVFPILGGALLAVVAARQIGIGAAAGLVLAGALGVAVSFASGEWRDGIVYPIWDCVQALLSFGIVLWTVKAFERRRSGHGPGRRAD